MLHHDDYVFLLRVVDGVLNNPDQPRFRKVRADIPQVVRVREELEEIGFVFEDGKFVLGRDVDEEVMRQQRQRLQDLADMALDPEKISLAQVAEVLQRNGRLPGIDNTINDEPTGETLNLGDGSERPKKPWEN